MQQLVGWLSQQAAAACRNWLKSPVSDSSSAANCAVSYSQVQRYCLAGACWSSSEPGGGRLLVLGAAGLFDDAWLDKEDNSRLSDFVFKWLRPVSTRLLRVERAALIECSSCTEQWWQASILPFYLCHGFHPTSKALLASCAVRCPYVCPAGLQGVPACC
jgi:hypothetical protein